MQVHETQANVIAVNIEAQSRPYSAHSGSAWATPLETARTDAGLSRQELKALRSRIDVVRKDDGVEYVGVGDTLLLLCHGPNGASVVRWLCGIVLPTIASDGEYYMPDSTAGAEVMGSPDWASLPLDSLMASDDWKAILLNERELPNADQIRRWIFDDVLPRLAMSKGYALAA
ncbi:hypothetical protein SmB9_30500 [Sphingosinicella microcystinivorans]|uniref:Uncharacterized protein n=2 Tax=Sphingosinicella microcystinivorans TaxID=335406 RepID=A0AAD1D7N2_SPHMI|nr:hypothetical protein [Sphingosinicella microcystinivorans]RKS86505.1 hypothetical protein DFR51_3212 [Sphingosinicella microcystinivorans]BBE35392.1 hypothetical protein SmB9_30500 [Sphingosinicella microcystinivorans]